MRKLEERESPRRDRARRERMSDVYLGFQMTSFDIGFQVLKYGLMFQICWNWVNFKFKCWVIQTCYLAKSNISNEMLNTKQAIILFSDRTLLHEIDRNHSLIISLYSQISYRSTITTSCS